MQRAIRHGRVDTDDSQQILQQISPTNGALSRQVRYSSEGEEHTAMRLSHGEGAGDSSQEHRRFSVTDEAPSARADGEHDIRSPLHPLDAGNQLGSSRYSVLVAKVLTNSDAVSGRVILPRIAVEANLPFISGYRSYALTVRDREGHNWEFAIKSWANGSENRRVYVLEQALEFLRAYNLGQGDAVGICTSEDGTLVVEANTPSVKAATVRPVFGMLAPEHTPPPMPGKVTPLLCGAEPGKCSRNPNCTKPCGHPGFCSGPRLKAKQSEGEGPAGSEEEGLDGGHDGEDLGDAVVLAKVLTEYDVTHGRLVLPHGQVEYAFPQARSQPHFLLKVCDMRLRQWELHVRAYHNAGRSMMYVVEDAADLLNANSLQPEDCIALFSRGGRLMLEVNTEEASRAAKRVRGDGSTAAGGRTQAAPTPSYGVQVSGDMLVCTRTPGCTKCPGHQGFCSGHKGFKRRERSGATGSTATSDDERGASRALSSGTKRRRRLTTGSDVDCEEHEAGPSSSRDDYPKEESDSEAPSRRSGASAEDEPRSRPMHTPWQHMAATAAAAAGPPQRQPRPLPATPPRGSQGGYAPEVRGNPPPRRSPSPMCPGSPLRAPTPQHRTPPPMAIPFPMVMEPPLPSVAARQMSPHRVIKMEGAAPVPPAVITLPKKMPPEINVKCGTMRGRFMVAQGLVTGLTGSLKGRMMSMSEFERHGGKGHVKKWRDSLFVDEPGHPHDNMTLGTWLRHYGINTLPKAKVRPGSVKAAVAAAQQQDAQRRAGGLQEDGTLPWRGMNAGAPDMASLAAQGLVNGLPPLPSLGRLPVPDMHSPAHHQPPHRNSQPQQHQQQRLHHGGFRGRQHLVSNGQWSPSSAGGGGGCRGPGGGTAGGWSGEMPPPAHRSAGGHHQHQHQQHHAQQPRHERQMPGGMQWPTDGGRGGPAAYPQQMQMQGHQQQLQQQQMAAMPQQQQRAPEGHPGEQQGPWPGQLGRVETEAAGVLLSLLQSGGDSEAASIREAPEVESLRRNFEAEADLHCNGKKSRAGRKRRTTDGTSEASDSPQEGDNEGRTSPSIITAKRAAVGNATGINHSNAIDQGRLDAAAQQLLPPLRALSVTSVVLEGWGSGLSSLLASSEFAGLNETADAETLSKEPPGLATLHAVFDQMAGGGPNNGHQQYGGGQQQQQPHSAAFPTMPGNSAASAANFYAASSAFDDSLGGGPDGFSPRQYRGRLTSCEVETPRAAPMGAPWQSPGGPHGDSMAPGANGGYYPQQGQGAREGGAEDHGGRRTPPPSGRYDRGAAAEQQQQQYRGPPPAGSPPARMDSAAIESLVGMLAPRQPPSNGADTSVTMRDIEDKVFRMLVTVCAQKFRSRDMTSLLSNLAVALPPSNDPADDVAPAPAPLVHSLEVNPEYQVLRQRYGGGGGGGGSEGTPSNGGMRPPSSYMQGPPAAMMRGGDENAMTRGAGDDGGMMPAAEQGSAAPPQGLVTLQLPFLNQRPMTPPQGTYGSNNNSNEGQAARAPAQPQAAAYGEMPSPRGAPNGHLNAEQLMQKGGGAHGQYADMQRSASAVLPGQYSDAQRGGTPAAPGQYADMQRGASAALPGQYGDAQRGGAPGQYADMQRGASAPLPGQYGDLAAQRCAPAAMAHEGGNRSEELLPVQPLHVPSIE